MKSTAKLKKERFAEMAVHTRCNAFEFESGFMHYEFHPDFSSKEKYPEFKLKKKSTFGAIQGTFNYMRDNSVADLWFVLTGLEEQGVEFYTFWSRDKDGGEGEWIIWTPGKKLA
tara:strand:+ start:2796 stop:3137 length:342 start_codon:yes stop_codon:yes gene_type:complete